MMLENLKPISTCTRTTEMLIDVSIALSMVAIFNWIYGYDNSSYFLKTLNSWMKYLGGGIAVTCFFLLIVIIMQIALKEQSTQALQNLSESELILYNRPNSNMLLKLIATVSAMIGGILLGAKVIPTFSIFLAFSTFFLAIANLFLLGKRSNRRSWVFIATKAFIMFLLLIESGALITNYLHLDNITHVSIETFSIAASAGFVAGVFLTIATVAAYFFQRMSIYTQQIPDSHAGGDNSEDDIKDDEEDRRTQLSIAPGSISIESH